MGCWTGRKEDMKICNYKLVQLVIVGHSSSWSTCCMWCTRPFDNFLPAHFRFLEDHRGVVLQVVSQKDSWGYVCAAAWLQWRISEVNKLCQKLCQDSEMHIGCAKRTIIYHEILGNFLEQTFEASVWHPRWFPTEVRVDVFDTQTSAWLTVLTNPAQEHHVHCFIEIRSFLHWCQ